MSPMGFPNPQPFYHNQRGMIIPRQPPPTNQPMYSSPPGGPMAVQIGPPGATQLFVSPGQRNSSIERVSERCKKLSRST